MDAQTPAESGEPDPGPLQALAIDVLDGAIGPVAAREQAGQYGTAGAVTPTQLASMAGAALDAIGRAGWRRTLPVAELTYSAAGTARVAHPDDVGYSEAWLSVAADLLEIVHAALIEHGDLRLFLRARGTVAMMFSPSRGIHGRAGSLPDQRE